MTKQSTTPTCVWRTLRHGYTRRKRRDCAENEQQECGDDDEENAELDDDPDALDDTNADTDHACKDKALEGNTFEDHSASDELKPCIGIGFRKYYLRKKQAALRCRRFDKFDHKQVQDYFREQIMLFAPGSMWAKELDDTKEVDSLRMEHVDHAKCFEALTEMLLEKRMQYESEQDPNDQDVWLNAVANVTEDLKRAREQEDTLDVTRWSAPAHAELGDRSKELQYDIGLDMQGHRQLCTGGAGVGKTVLLRALYQAVRRTYKMGLDVDPEKPTVLVVAPTGSTAHNVQGATIHSTCGMRPCSDDEWTTLSPDKRNTMRATYLQWTKPA